MHSRYPQQGQIYELFFGEFKGSGSSSIVIINKFGYDAQQRQQLTTTN